MVRWCRALSARGICWTIENPSNSLIWAFPGLRDMVAEAHVVHLHSCMFGSQRKKATALASNRSWFRKTNIQCSGDHPHASWGKTRSSGKPVRATSLESAYTPELSHAWASCAASALERELRAAPPSKKRVRKEACEPDFDNIITVHAAEAAPFAGMFAPCKVPRRFARWPRAPASFSSTRQIFRPRLALPSPPEVWCRRAMSLQHPRKLLQPLSPDLEKALEAEISHDECRVGRCRTEACQDIGKVCRSSLTEEGALRKGLNEDVLRVTEPKQSVAMKRLLVQIGHVDPSVADAVREGFPLVGWLPGLWDSDCEPPVLSIEALSRGLRQKRENDLQTPLPGHGAQRLGSHQGGSGQRLADVQAKQSKGTLYPRGSGSSRRIRFGPSTIFVPAWSTLRAASARKSRWTE